MILLKSLPIGPIQFGVGISHSLWMDSIGRLWTGGANSNGQLGDLTTDIKVQYELVTRK